MNKENFKDMMYWVNKRQNLLTPTKKDLDEILELMAKVKNEHPIPNSPVTSVLIYKILEKWINKPLCLIKSKINRLNELSLKIDISYKKEYVEFICLFELLKYKTTC